MKKSDIRHAVKEFEREFGYLTPIDPQLIGFSWAIGRQGDNVILVRKYPHRYDFSQMTNENYQHWRINNNDEER